MYQKIVLLLVCLATILPLNSAPNAQVIATSVSPLAVESLPKPKLWDKRKEKRKSAARKFTPVLPAITLALGILAVGTFIFAGWPGIIIGTLAVFVGSVVLTRRNGYTKRDRTIARIGVLLGSLFLTLGLLVIIYLLEPAGVNFEAIEPLFEHILR
ncbi:MAG: hypothetical protein AAFP02_17530 [Bacteroidota bacterium]